jgi:hypothetical protein
MFFQRKVAYGVRRRRAKMTEQSGPMVDIYHVAVQAMAKVEEAIKEALAADIAAYKDQGFTDEDAAIAAVRAVNRRVKDVCWSETKLPLNVRNHL